MKWNPQGAVARHAAEVMADPKSSAEDAATARRAIADPWSAEVLDALPEEELERLIALDEAELARLSSACPTCARTTPAIDPDAS